MYPVSQGFGENPLDYPEYMGHPGIDWATPEGTPLMAPHDGVVVWAGASPAWPGRGIYLAVEVEPGFVWYLMHLSGLAVTAGDAVDQGQLVAWSGSTGVFRWAGSPAPVRVKPHLHFDVRREGVPVDPASLGIRA